MREKRYIVNDYLLIRHFFVWFILSVFICFITRDLAAQHIDVFKLDYSKEGEKEKKIDVGFIEVEDHIKYTIAIGKEKLDKKDFDIYDLELLEIPTEDLDKFRWHQVDCLLEKDISETQTRTAGSLKCTRSRSGRLYWLANGKKHVHWGRWSFWSCAKGG